MGVDYHVAIHEADWPTPAALNRCMAQLRYPVEIGGVIASKMNDPLAVAPMTIGLAILFEGEPLELETSITKLGPDSPYAYTLGPSLPKTVETLSDGTIITTATPTSLADFVPADLNEDLRRLGANAPDFADGDYVITLTFRISIEEWRAGWFLMAGLIRCANGFGFEFQDGQFGTGAYADFLAKNAGDSSYWR